MAVLCVLGSAVGHVGFIESNGRGMWKVGRSDQAINKGVEAGWFNFNPSWSEFCLYPSCLFC